MANVILIKQTLAHFVRLKPAGPWIRLDQLPLRLSSRTATSRKTSDHSQSFPVDEYTKHEDDPRLHVLTSEGAARYVTDYVVPGKGPPPDPPSTCCMSGCANCVYLKYVEELVKYYEDGGEKALEALDKQVDDENLKAFLRLELKGHIR